MLRLAANTESLCHAQDTINSLLTLRQVFGRDRAQESVPLALCPSFHVNDIYVMGMMRMSSKVAPTVFPLLGKEACACVEGADASGASAVKVGTGVEQRKAVETCTSSLSTTSMPCHTHMSSSIFKAYSGPKDGLSYQVGFKREDVRKDWIIQGMVSYMHRCLELDGIDVPNTTYCVLPTSADDGLVQWVPDCITLAALKVKGKTIHSFIAERNRNIATGALEQTFMRSLAASTVFTFLLVSMI